MWNEESERCRLSLTFKLLLSGSGPGPSKKYSKLRCLLKIESGIMMKFIHSKHLLSAYYVPVIVLSIGTTRVNRTNKVSILKEIEMMGNTQSHTQKLYNYNWNKYYKGKV